MLQMLLMYKMTDKIQITENTFSNSLHYMRHFKVHFYVYFKL